MIKKSILFTIFLLICWSIFINKITFSISQHQWQSNIISAEKFIFDIDSIDNLILGSSLARRLQMDSLPNFYNLSLSGQSLFDGLNILKNRKHLPRNVFIEINVIDRGENLNFKEIVSSSILNTLKESAPIFRTDKQPLAYVGRKFISPTVNKFFNKIIYRIRGEFNIDNQANKTGENKSNNSIFDKLLALKKASYSKEVNTQRMDKQFELLKSHVDYLVSKGVNVIFFEMPVNPQLIQLNKAKYIRDRITREYPNFGFVKQPLNMAFYKTADGHHLTHEESRIYTSYFKKESKNVANIALNASRLR